MIAVVAHHEVAARWDHRSVGIGGVGRPIRLADPGVVGREIRLLQLASIDEHLSVSNQEAFAGQADYSLDEVLRVVEGILEDHDVPARRSGEAKVNLGREHVVVVVQRWNHREANDVHGLDGECDHDVEPDGEQQDLRQLDEK